MDGKSLDITAQKTEALKALFPEIFSEGKVDFDRLKAALGEDRTVQGEHYELSWAGKTEARKEVQKQTTATLLPDRENSIDFDTAQNVFIEGENLEVLRTLQKAYAGKVKMIYIDPPYNTGNDSFVYPDDYSERREAYDRRTGKTDDEGFLNKQDLWRKNSRESGQFHSVWLSMMYPRLYLARNLMREDGVIFVSIDDNEQANLKLLLDDVFGEENFVANLIWKSGRTAAAHFANEHEYIICYSKNKQKLPLFSFEGEDSISDRAIKRPSDKNPVSAIRFPKGMDFESEDKIFPTIFGNSEPVKVIDGIFEAKDGKLLNNVTLEAAWTMKEMINSWIDGEEVIDQKGQLVKRFFFKSNGVLQYEKEKGTIHPKSIIVDHTTKSGSKSLNALLGSTYFDFPKPPDLIRDLCEIVTKDDDIVLDFFAGSATTAHAILEQNEMGGGLIVVSF